MNQTVFSSHWLDHYDSFEYDELSNISTNVLSNILSSQNIELAQQFIYTTLYNIRFMFYLANPYETMFEHTYQVPRYVNEVSKPKTLTFSSGISVLLKFCFCFLQILVVASSSSRERNQTHFLYP